MSNGSKKRLLILAGGGIKVSFQAGVLQVWLDEAGLTFDHVDAASGVVFHTTRISKPPVILFTLSLTVLLLISLPVCGQKPQPDNCKWKSTAIDRAKVKNRALKLDRYPKHNNGESITISEFYDLVCSFNAPAKKDIVTTVPIPDLEEKTVTVRGFLLAAKFERGQDHDIHAQVAASEEWDQDQLIIEVPAGGKYCPVRKALWGLVRKDRENSGSHSKGDTIKFADPPEVTVTGYLFLDAHHITKKTTPAKYCIDNGWRGLQKNGKSSVRGLWELHPVIAVRALQ